MNWLIIGTGWISKDYVSALKELNENVYAILSRKEETGKAFANENNIDLYLTDDKEHINNFDAVYIGTPNPTHFELAKKYISLGKNVMVEKPMTLSYKETKELFDLADKHGVRLMEAYIHITQPIVKTLKGKNIKTNYMRVSSKIKNGTYKTASTFLPGGGALYDIGVYPLSLSIMILGPVKEAKVSNVIKLDNGVETELHLELVHENGNSEFGISKINDSDNSFFLDGNKLSDSTAFSPDENGMIQEVKLFTSNKDLSWIKEVSLNTAKAIDLIRTKI